MEEIYLTKSELFESLLEIRIGENYIDLHSDYDCLKLMYSDNNDFLLVFNSLSSNGLVVSLKFSNTTFSSINLLFNEVTESVTLDSFYRGRFEKDGILKEYSEDGQSYFYLEFYEGGAIELLSDRVVLIVQKEVPGKD